MDTLQGLRMPKHTEDLLRKLIDRFLSSENVVHTTMAQALSDAAELPIRTAKTKYLTVGPLHVQTGRLRASVTKRPPYGAQKIGTRKYSVSVGSPVWYGKAWELGFEHNGHKFFPKKWLEPSFRDNMAKIKDIIDKAAARAMEVNN